MLKKETIKFILLSFVIVGCNSGSLTRDDKFKQNPELKKAFDFYASPKDSLKKKAMLFLIDNLEYKSGLDSAIANTFSPSMKYLFNTRKEDLPVKIKDSIEQLYAARVLSNERPYIHDLDKISSELLIENIEYAFKIRELPWNKKLSFSAFCEYILPYRILNEPLSRWRKVLFEAYKPLMDSLRERGVDDPTEVCKVINKHIFRNFTFHDILIPNLAVEQLHRVPTGECIQRYILVTATMRTFGLPVTLDFVRQYPRWPGSHFWTVLLNATNGKLLAFNGGDAWEENPFKGVKIYRKTFRNYAKEDTSFELFNNPTTIDVTNQYPYIVKDLTISIQEPVNNQVAYLVTFGIGSDLVPIDKGVISNHVATFKNVSFSEESLVLPSILENGKLRLLGNPTSILLDGSTGVFKPDVKKLRKVRCTSKYPVTWPMSEFAKRIVGAKVQGSNKSDFSDSTTLLTFTEVPWDFKHIRLESKEYNYYRYLPKPSTSINLAEFQFYLHSKKDSMCMPSILKSISPSIDSNELKNVSDWNIRTNLNSKPDQWFGIDVSKSNAKRLCEIAILTRNDYNVIEKGHLYELFYFDHEWISLEEKTATNFFMEFENVPTGAIMMLHDLTTGKQERIFEYKDNQQIFW